MHPLILASLLLSIDLAAPIAPPMSGHLKMGGKNPQGVEINANSQYLTLGGKPWYPVMGEFHYSRVPHERWEEELLKMKAGGITVVSTYVFWIHHEEVEGQFDWTGDRDLRSFVQLCAKHGLSVYVRLGPWCHGEVRNGGFPDWVLQKCKIVRKNDPTFMGYVRTLYQEEFKQLNGLMWKDGGPVIGIQVENELTGDPGYLLALKNLAKDVGFAVPLYSVTGWGPARIPQDEVLPLFGGYADGFWLGGTGISREGRKQYFFSHVRNDSSIGEDLLPSNRRPDMRGLERYPFLTCECGGGMAIAYIRRPLMSSSDVTAEALCKIGSGSNLMGYYMYHGGTNPVGKLSTLQETQATKYPNDLPVFNYDFQAPLGQYGQVRDSYHALRMLHMFLADFGSDLAPMPSTFPQAMPKNADDTETLRWAVRSDGHRGFIFINNYERGIDMPDQLNAQFSLNLVGGNETVPVKPVRIPGNEFMIWPFNLDLNGSTLKYATAQLLCKLDDPTEPTYVFLAPPGVDPEFFVDGGVVMPPQPGPNFLITLHNHNAKILVLTQNQAMRCWKANLWGKDRLFMSNNDLWFDGSTLHVQSEGPTDMSFSVYPAPEKPPTVDGKPLPTAPNGVFTRYLASKLEQQGTMMTYQLVRKADPPRAIRKGSRGKPEQPSDADFDAAGVWQVAVPDTLMDRVHSAVIRVDYVGDAARAYVGDELIDDDFYCGKPWEIDLGRHLNDAIQKGLTIKILPLRSDLPVYIQDDRRPKFDDNGQALQVRGIAPRFEYELEVQ